LVLSEAFGFGPPIEKRTMAGVCAPLNSAALEIAFASGAAVNVPTVQAPF
jgi:hypothetical protein